MASYSRIQLEKWLSEIEVKGKVLDVGGSQNPIKGRTKTWEAEDYNILDLVVPHEEKQKTDIIMDLNTYTAQDNTKEYISYFDIAFCIEVMEYIYNPSKALKNIHTLLKSKGILYLSIHTLYGLHKPENEDSLRYTRYGIVKLLQKTNFEIMEITPRTITQEGRQALAEFYKAEGMRILYNEETFKCGYLIKAKKI